jgi:hypothetical protein
LITAVLGLLVFAIFAGYALNAYLNRPGRFCYRNYQRIQVGMALNAVESLLVGPRRRNRAGSLVRRCRLQRASAGKTTQACRDR